MLLKQTETYADQTELGLELLQGVQTIVNEGETGRSATTELRLETERHNHVAGRLEDLAQSLADFLLRNTRLTRVNDVNHHLLALQQPV